MISPTEEHFEHIYALAHAKIKTAHNQEVLDKRISIVEKQIASYREFASKNPDSRPAQFLLQKAQEWETKLIECLV